jgi:hypothetical protein
MKTLLSICSVAVLLPTLTAAQGTAPPQAATPPAVVMMTMASTIVQQYTSVKDLWIKTADAMPADAYSFQPTPEMRTFAGGMGHVLASNISQCNSLVGRKHALTGVDLEKTLTTKADTVKAVADTFAFCDEYFLKIDETTSIADAYVNMTGKRRTGEPVTFKVSNGASIVHFLTHNNEMYGYLAVYLRLKGIVPPSSVHSTGPGGSGGGR